MATCVWIPTHDSSTARTYQPAHRTGLHATTMCCHGDRTCCHGDRTYNPLLYKLDVNLQQPRRCSVTTERSSSRPLPACRVIRVLLVTCFAVNILVLVSLQLLPYVTSHITSDVTHDTSQHPVGRSAHTVSAMLRQLRQVAELEEELLPSDVTSVEDERRAMSPFTNWTQGLRTDWEVSRDLFRASAITFPVNEPGVCDNQPFIVIMVTSAVTNLAQRQTIRDTWGSVVRQGPGRATLVFLLGVSASPNATLAQLVRAESQTHRDIVQASIVDSYSNLAFKSIGMLKWMELYCASARHLLKADDDMYINVDNLHRELQHSVHTRFVMGDIIAGAQPMQDRTSKWYTPPAMFPHSRYPKYVSGSAYVISGDVVHDLYVAAQAVPVFWLEDVFITGVCAKHANVTHVYNGKFGYKRRRLSPCLFKVIVTGHRLTMGEMHRMWKALQSEHLDCSNINIRTTVA